MKKIDFSIEQLLEPLKRARPYHGWMSSGAASGTFVELSVTVCDSEEDIWKL